ncbi:hypothetical protein [Methylobacterium sp. JK268]
MGAALALPRRRTAPPAWLEGLASLSPHRLPCPGFRDEEWATTLAHARRFVDEFGAEADRLGWDTLTLFGVHPEAGTIRGDWCGVLMPCSYPVHAINAFHLRKHVWTSYRLKPGRGRGVPVWAFGREAPRHDGVAPNSGTRAGLSPAARA